MDWKWQQLYKVKGSCQMSRTLLEEAGWWTTQLQRNVSAFRTKANGWEWSWLSLEVIPRVWKVIKQCQTFEHVCLQSVYPATTLDFSFYLVFNRSCLFLLVYAHLTVLYCWPGDWKHALLVSLSANGELCSTNYHWQIGNRSHNCNWIWFRIGDLELWYWYCNKWDPW